MLSDWRSLSVSSFGVVQEKNGGPIDKRMPYDNTVVASRGSSLKVAGEGAFPLQKRNPPS